MANAVPAENGIRPHSSHRCGRRRGTDPTPSRQRLQPRSVKGGHLGLQSMRERAGRIGARLDIVSTAAGTDVMLVVPGNVLSQPGTVPAAT